MKYDNQLRYATTIVSTYDGAIPLAAWLKDFFRKHKQMGSRDRKTVAEMVYGYYRLGHLSFSDVRQRMLAGILAGNTLTDMIGYFGLADNPDYDVYAQLGGARSTAGLPDGPQGIGLSGELQRTGLSDELRNARLPEGMQNVSSPDGLQHAGLPGELRDVGLSDRLRGLLFPWKDELSTGIDADAFEASFLHKPDLFIRIRPGYEPTVRKKLDSAGIIYGVEGACVSLPTATKLEGLLEVDREVVIQDRSSQRTGEFLQQLPVAVRSWWDCCAGSGGKSILAYDLLQGGRPKLNTITEEAVTDEEKAVAGDDIHITVSDNRKTILHNLRDRFARAGITHCKSSRVDLTDPSSPLPGEPFDLIIADVPCTGSGTWARTPEQLYYFKSEKLDHYVALQKKILARVTGRLKPGGALLYLTCSVFARENEAMVRYLEQRSGLRLIRSSVIPGYFDQADTMFGALLIADR